MDGVAGAVLKVEAVRTDDDVVADEQLGDVDRVEDLNGELCCPLDEGALQFQARVVAGECGAAEGVRAEEALRDSSVLFTREGHTPALQVRDRFRRTLGDHLHCLGIGEQVALGERVGRVLLPRVIRIHGGQRRVDAPGGQRGVRVCLRPLTDDKDADSLLREFDRRA